MTSNNLRTIKDKLIVLISYIYWRKNKGRGYAIFTQRDVELVWLYFFGMPANMESITRVLRKLVEEGFIEAIPNNKCNGKGRPRMLYKVYESVVIPEETVYSILSKYNIIGCEHLFELIDIFRNPDIFRPIAYLYLYYRNPNSVPEHIVKYLEEQGYIANGELTLTGKYLVNAIRTLLRYYMSKKKER